MALLVLYPRFGKDKTFSGKINLPNLVDIQPYHEKLISNGTLFIKTFLLLHAAF